MALVLTVGVTDRTSVLVKGSLSVEHRGGFFVSVCGFTLHDTNNNITISDEDDVSLVDGATTFFTGRVVEVKYKPFTTKKRHITIKCQDLNAQLNETVIDDTEEFTAVADSAIIDALFDEYLPAVDSQTHVATIQDPLTIDLGPCTLRSALSQICTRTGGIFYVDFDNKLHYFEAEADVVAWWLSDDPDQIDSFSYHKIIKKSSRAVSRLDGVFVIGDGVEGWRGTHAAGDRCGMVRDNRITTSTGVNNRGDAILATYGTAQVTYDVTTLKAGLMAGMDVRLICALYGVDDTFTVRKMTVKWGLDKIARYELELGDPLNPSLNSERQWVDTITEALGPITAPRLPTSSKGWSHSLVFSATDHDTVAWALGDIVLADGTTYNIVAGNTGNIAAITYIFLDLDTSETILQTTTDSSVAVGSKKILIAWAKNQAAGMDATYLVFGGAGQGVLVDTDQIVNDAITAAKTRIGLQGWSHDLVFSATDHNTVAWASGTIRMADGTTYNIVAGNTSNMGGMRYIYLDTNSSITILRVTTFVATAVGDNKILIAVAKNVAVGKDATFQTFGGEGLGVMITADQIVANTVTANEIATNTITANEILGNTITAAEIAANTISAAEILANTITAAEILANTITATEIAANTITATQILGNTITATEIAANTITTNEIAVNTILAGNIASGAIETDKLDALAVTAAKIAANTITATKLSMGIGETLFNNADGLLLLGPHSEINDTEWWSLQRQKATISGAFTQVAGRFPGTRALRVDPAGTNLVTNPSLEVGTAGWTWSVAAQGAGYGRITTDDRFGVACGKAVCSGAISRYVRTPFSRGANDDVTISAWVKSLTGISQLRLRLYGANWGNYVEGTLVSVGAQWTRLTLTVPDATMDGWTQPTNLLLVISNDSDGGTNKTWLFDAAQAELTDYATFYLDGSLGTGFAWAGTAHASTSTRTATEVNLDTHTDIISSNPTLTFAMWVQMPYDADATWPVGRDNYLFDVYGASGRIIVEYHDVNDRFYVYLKDSWVITSSVQTWDAGMWLFLVVTIDCVSHEHILYINGVQDSSSSSVKAAGVITEWNIGGRYSGIAHQAGWVFAEYAVLDSILTADEVAAQFALQRPLIDGGSSDVPGLFILDGKFRIASSVSGNRIEIVADEIAGYSAAGVKQFYLQASDGKAMAGGGDVVLDEDGITLGIGTDLKDKVKWNSSAGTLMGQTYSWWGGTGSDPLVMMMQSVDPDSETSDVRAYMSAKKGAADTRIRVFSTRYVDFTACDRFLIYDDVRYLLDVQQSVGVSICLADKVGGRSLKVTDSDVVTQFEVDSDGNLELGGSIDKSTALGCRAYRSTTQSIPDSIWTALSWNTQVHDTDGCFAPTSSYMYARHAGYYMAGGCAKFAGSAVGTRLIAVYNQAGCRLAHNAIGAPDIASDVLSISTGMFYMAADTWVQIKVWQNIGVNLNVDAATSTDHKNSGWLVRLS